MSGLAGSKLTRALTSPTWNQPSAEQAWTVIVFLVVLVSSTSPWIGVPAMTRVRSRTIRLWTAGKVTGGDPGWDNRDEPPQATTPEAISASTPMAQAPDAFIASQTQRTPRWFPARTSRTRGLPRAEILDSVEFEVDALVVREGDRVTAEGCLVRNEHGDWFQPPLPSVRLGPAGQRGAATVWRGAVRVAGANFGDLETRFGRDGTVQGFARLTGIWSGNLLRVQQQARPQGQPGSRLPRWATPPGPPPEGGWPDLGPGPGDRNLDFDLGDLRETGAAVCVTLFRPSQTKAVLVVAAADSDAVEARLRPQLGRRLCVVPSRWTSGQLGAVRANLHQHQEEWNLYQWGESSTEDGQARITAGLTRVVQEIAPWASSLPPGILALEPWLAPMRV